MIILLLNDLCCNLHEGISAGSAILQCSILVWWRGLFFYSSVTNWMLWVIKGQHNSLHSFLFMWDSKSHIQLERVFRGEKNLSFTYFFMIKGIFHATWQRICINSSTFKFIVSIFTANLSFHHVILDCIWSFWGCWRSVDRHSGLKTEWIVSLSSSAKAKMNPKNSKIF